MKNPFKDLTKFELLLWSFSIIIVSASFLLAPAKDYMTLTASFIGVTALIFVAKGYVVGQLLTVIFAVFYGIISFWFRYYGEMITYLGMTSPMAILAAISWLKHPFEKSSEVTVSKLTKRQIVIMLGLTIIVTFGFFFILKRLGTANLIFSTISVTTSFLASFLTFLRSEYYALGYAANDLVLIVLWVMATMENISYFPMIICFIMFLANDLYGFWNWQKMKMRQSLVQD